VLVAVVGTAFLALSVHALQRLATGFVAAPARSARSDVAGSISWLRALSLPIAVLAAILVWAASAGVSLRWYALTYAGLLLAPIAVAVAWPRPRAPAIESDRTRRPEDGLAAPRRGETWPLALLLGLVLALWLPVELSLLPPLPRLGSVGVPVTKFVTVVMGLWTFLVVRPIEGVGHGLALDGMALRAAMIGFAAFAAIALPLGFLLDFLVWNPRSEASLYLLRPILIFFTIAIPEEFVFRGLLQRALTDRFGYRPALAIAAVVFGLAHAPSIAYIVLATIAGVAYGWVYQRTGRVAAAAVTHTLVDAVWVLLLRR
jgi:hypothetical protein